MTLTDEEILFLQEKREQCTYYYHRDHQGSITHLTDEEGKVVESFTYDAYGTILEHSQTQPTLNPYGYTGREFEVSVAEQTGIVCDLYYYRARYYDPMQGRFISQDPIEFMAGDVNFYRYVGGDPVNFVDPSGHNRMGDNINKNYEKACGKKGNAIGCGAMTVMVWCMPVASQASAASDVEEVVESIVKNGVSKEAVAMAAAALIPGRFEKALPDIDLPKPKAKNSKKTCEKASKKESGFTVEAEKRCGGSHRDMKKPKNDKLDSHHAPDRKADPNVSDLDGSAIKMDPRDHKETSSHGRSREARAYADETKKMIANKEHRKAMAREVKDIRNAAHEGSGNRKKYNQCIKQMLEYAKKHGQLPPKK